MNSNHLTNVFVNILENAIKYSKETPKIEVTTSQINENILIEIKDNGLGMSKQVLKKIFDKFYRVNSGDIHNVKGHGLGLSYVKEIVEAHNGEVFADSELNKGSKFYIKLPIIN